MNAERPSKGETRVPGYLLAWLLILSVLVVLLSIRAFWPSRPAAPPAVENVSPAEPALGREAGYSTLTALEAAFADIAAQVSPAVVNIRVEQAATEDKTPWSESLEEFFRRFFGEEGPFFFHPDREDLAVGSGMIFRPDGYILTNAHVVHQAKRIEVKLAGEKKPVEARLLGSDPRTDLAVIKVPRRNLPTVKFGDSDRAHVGSWVLAIGSPYEFESTVTVGIISARERELPDPRLRGIFHRDLLQTDASINPGNSGGPLVNSRGEVIGVNLAIYSPSGGNVGIGFAVPINTAREILDELIERGTIERGYLGVAIERRDSEVLETLYGVREGALVTEVREGSPAERAGLQADDVIVEFNGRKVSTPEELVDVVTATRPGTEVTITFLRNRRRLTRRVTVDALPAELGGAAKPERKSRRATVAAGEEDLLGLTVVEITPRLVKQFRLPQHEGVLIRGVQPDSPADKAGLPVGSIITKIRSARGTCPIRSLTDYRRALRAVQGQKYLDITVVFRLRGEEQRRIFTVEMK